MIEKHNFVRFEKKNHFKMIKFTVINILGVMLKNFFFCFESRKKYMSKKNMLDMFEYTLNWQDKSVLLSLKHIQYQYICVINVNQLAKTFNFCSI